MDARTITMPRPNRDELIGNRRASILCEIRRARAQLNPEALAAQATSPLPDKVEPRRISGGYRRRSLRVWRAHQEVKVKASREVASLM